MKSRILIGTICLAALTLLGACRRQEILTLEMQELFSLEIGKLEDNMDLFQIDGVSTLHKNRIYMRDGIIYIANGNANKVMQFTSFGDLLTLIYNPDQNPRPVMLDTGDERDTLINKRAVAHNFHGVGDLLVTDERNILVEDRLPEERAVYDEDSGLILDRVIRRFDAEGTYLDYIGREGVGGSPFPFISDLFLSDDGSVTVVARSLQGSLVYRFDRGGDLITTVDISVDRLPVPDQEQYIPSLQTIVAAPERPVLYVLLYYYARGSADGPAPQFSVDQILTRIYELDLRTGRYERFVDVPRNVRVLEGDDVFARQEVEYAYELIGTGPNGVLFLLSPESDSAAQLLLLAPDGRVIRRRNLRFDSTDLFLKEFVVSPQGILTGMLVREDRVDVVWWRSDRLLTSEEQQ